MSGFGGAPALIAQLPGHTNSVNNVILVPNDTALISVSDDRTLRVWIKRTSGEYWPSVCQTLDWCVTCLTLENFHLFAGLESGAVNHYKLSEDLNRITLLRIYNSHQMRVSAVLYNAEKDWLLSAGKDKTFHWFTGETGRRLGSYNAGAWCLCIAVDRLSHFVFIGDYSGVISMLKLDPGAEFKLITTLKGHSASVRALQWDEVNQRLVSCSADKSIFIWEVGEGKGRALELNAHSARINDIVYSRTAQKIFSFGSDKKMIVWNLRTERQQTPLWEESNECQLCKAPFFWNFQKMWQEKDVHFKRQHHCRRCGAATCGDCSITQSILPCLGYELPVRLCSPCYGEVSEDELRSSTCTHNILVDPVCVDFDSDKKLLAIGAADHVIRLYDIASCL